MTELTAEIVRELLDYNPDTGEFVWKHRTENEGNFNARWEGRVAGTKDRKGYITIKIQGKKYAAHRLAWLFTYCEWPVDQVDHINNIRDDNRICNLRQADSFINSQNQKRAQKDNVSSGLLGVSFHKPNKKWLARINYEGRTHLIGCYDCKHKAHEAYLDAKAKHHSGYVAEHYK
jgi:hypothetical protein